jgi:hypothetical protein
MPVARGISCYERDRSGSTPTLGCQFIPTPTELRRRPCEGGLRVFDSRRGCHFAPLKHIEMCSALVMRRQLVQVQPSAPDMPSSTDSRAPVS